MSSINQAEQSLFKDRCRFSLEWSIQAVIRQHPGLLYGVSDETEAGIALYNQVHQIDRPDVLRVIDSNDTNSTTAEQKMKSADVLLSHILGDAHAEQWLPDKPAWKVIMLNHFHRNSEESDSDLVSLERIDIAFIAHHAIADGLSGVAFHASLMENFATLSASLCSPPWPMIFNEPRAAPMAIEERVDCLSCTCSVCSSPSTCDRKAWAGRAISQTPAARLKSMVRIITITPEELLAVLKKCKRASITLTGLLHALICTSLCRGIKEDVPGFRSVTPFSVRPHTGASKMDIVDHVSCLISYISNAELEKIQECEPGSMAEDQRIIELAEFFGRDITTKVRQFPHGSMVTSLNRIQDLVSHCESQGGTERKYTYELSNLGSTSDILPPDGSNLKLEKLVFTQCAMVAGPAIGFNCASTRGGPLVISITWEQGIIEESVVDHVVRELKERLVCVGGNDTKGDGR
ncbi:hypothetical protein ACHAP5_006696 [Fusarium lateritium]